MLNQFWLEVSQAYAKVNTDHTLEITVARDGQEAKVTAVSDIGVVIIITPKNTATPQSFIVPGGE